MSVIDLHLHDRAFPGPLGFAAFAGVKFCGYLFAAVVLKNLYPSIVAGAAKIAALRVGLGILIGPAFVIALAALANSYGRGSDSPFPGYFGYVVLVCLRIVIWAFVIWIFIRKTSEEGRNFWLYSFAGALWSSLLDIPAIVLLAISPGRIPIC